MIAIITDSSSNITQQEAAQLGITVMPLTIIFGDKEYRDGIDIDSNKFYDMLIKSKEFPHTSQLSEAQIEEAVESALKRFDSVLIMPIAAALSGSHERCARIAAKYNNVHVYDTRCTTVMLKILVMEAVKNADKSVQEVIKILDGLRPKIKLWAALDTLEYLGKGGRMSKTVATLGTVLKIKPVITINMEGEVELISKQVGMSKGISHIAKLVDIKKIDYSRPVFSIYTMNDENSLTLIEKIGIKCSDKDNICPVIGTHIGPNAAGIVYVEK